MNITTSRSGVHIRLSLLETRQFLSSSAAVQAVRDGIDLAQGREPVKANSQSAAELSLVPSNSTKKLPPDPEEMNELRAQWAATALQSFMGSTRQDDQEESMGDLLSNLRHLCDRHGFDFEDMLASAQENYQAETAA